MNGRDFDLGRLLRAAEAVAPVEAVVAVAHELKHMVAAEHASFLIADFSGDALIRLGHSGRLEARYAARDTRPPSESRWPERRKDVRWTPRPSRSSPIADGAWLFAPVTSRGEAVGVLELRVAAYPGRADVEKVALAAHALAYIVIANRRYTDLFEWGQRSVPLSLAAEIQHRLLPGVLHLRGRAVHPRGVARTGRRGRRRHLRLRPRIATRCISRSPTPWATASTRRCWQRCWSEALRNGRRRDADLAEQARLANDRARRVRRQGQFVTGQIVRVDLSAGTAEIVNAGHPPPLRLRNGVVDEVPLEADPPFGVDPDHTLPRPAAAA